jgi:hypothetical protein
MAGEEETSAGSLINSFAAIVSRRLNDMSKKHSHKKDPYLLDSIDSPEMIEKCLKCLRVECTNCHYYRTLRRYAKKKS